MFRKIVFICQLLFIGWLQPSFSQDDLLDIFGEEENKETEYAFATFKTTRVVAGQSIENPAPGELIFIISHRFGKINEGLYEYFGLDQSTIRFGFEYGFNKRLALGFGRSTFRKTYDGFIKYKLIRQSTGLKKMPVSISTFTSISIFSLDWEDPDRKNYFSSRIAYTTQLLIARKFNNSLSIQLSPTMVHKNLVPTKEDKNDIFAIGISGRQKITNRLSLNAEYFYLLPEQTAVDFYNTFSVGFDIETGGHVFQLHFTNAQPMFESAFITETAGSWTKGDIYFGFNITRVFTLKRS
ncbi:DUF5777 family beta-barrel protein [candidate division KSB1 bacterium]